MITEQRTADLAGIWQVTFDEGTVRDVRIPGTLDESGVGYEGALTGDSGTPESDSDDLRDLLRQEGLLFEDEEEQTEMQEDAGPSRCTRKYTYEGPIRISRTVKWTERPEHRVFLEVERARFLRLFVDETEVPYFSTPTLITPHVFELTGLIHGEHLLTIVSDNSYRGMPREGILASNMASEDTQTNWNGLLGRILLREERSSFIERLTVRTGSGKASCYMEIVTEEPGTWQVSLHSNALVKDYTRTVTLKRGTTAVVIEGLELRENAACWDEGKGLLYEMTADLAGDRKTVLFGIRDLQIDERGRITLNSRTVFLRGTTDFAVRPETGYLPATEESWEAVFGAFRDYGANFVRFASCCPPEAAFSVADRMGILIMAELSLADSADAFSDDTSRAYYRHELLKLLRVFGNHPSLAVVSFGSRIGLKGEGSEFARHLLELARRTDSSRFYAIGSGAKKEGRFTRDDGDVLCYSELDGGMPEATRRMAVIAADLGACPILPDFSELDLFSGFIVPGHLLAMQKNMERAGLMSSWKRLIENSGENALLARRETVSRAFRNPRLSGVALLSLQDFPGRDSALFGVLNSHMIPKPFDFSDPKRFRTFFSDQVLSIELPAYSYVYGSDFRALVTCINYSGEDSLREVTWTLTGPDIIASGSFPPVNAPSGGRTVLGCIRAKLITETDRASMEEPLTETEEEPADFEELLKNPLAFLEQQLRLEEEEEKREETGIPEPVALTLTVRSGKFREDRPVYLYPPVLPVCPDDVFEADGISLDVLTILRSGGTVFLTPPATEEALPGSEATGFSASLPRDPVHPDTVTTMGARIRKEHPVFRMFSTEDFSDLRWLRLMENSRAVELPRGVNPIIGELDSCRGTRKLGKLFEFRCLNGNVFFSCLGLKEKIHLPEGRNLLRSIYAYLDSYDFSPSDAVSLDELRSMISDIS